MTGPQKKAQAQPTGWSVQKTEMLCPSCAAGYMRTRSFNDVDVAHMCDGCGYVSDQR